MTDRPRLPQATPKALKRARLRRERARAQEALRQSAARYRALVENQSAGMGIVDPEECFVYANAAAEALLGTPPGGLVGRTLAEFLTAEQLAQMRAETDKREQGERRAYELRVLRPDGEPRWLLVNASPYIDAAGKFLGTLGVFHDITQRKQAEQQLRESEVRYRLLAETARDLILMHDLQGTVLYANPVVLQFGGYSSEELLGRPITDFIPAEYHAALQQRGQSRRTGDTAAYLYEIEFLTRQGERIPVEVNSSIFMQDGRPQGVLIVARDLSERRALRESEAQFRATLERRAAQLAILNEVGQQISAVLNPERLLEYTVTLIQERFDYTHVGLFLIDPATGKLTQRAKAGQFIHLFPPGHALTLGQGMVGWVAQTGTLLLANDVTQEPRYVNLYPDILPTAAELSVPLIIQDAVIGVLDVQSAERGAFDDNDVVAIVTLAGQIAVALQNARLYADAQKQQEQTEALRRASAALVETLELEEVLDRLLEQVVQLVANDAANIMLIEEDGVRVARAQGYERFACQEYIEALRYRLAEMPTLMQMQATGQPMVVADTHKNPLWVEHSQTAWLRSYAAVPLSIRGEVIGFLNVDSAIPDFFNEGVAERLQVFANQAAIAFENARLFSAAQAERNRMAILYDVTRQLSAASTREAIVQVITNVLPFVGVRDYDLLLLDVNGQPWFFATLPDRQQFTPDRLREYVQKTTTSGLESWVLAQRQTAVVSDTHADPRWLILPGHEAHDPVRAVICAPLYDRAGEIRGFLNYNHPEPHRFTAEDQRLAEEIAARIAAALDNAALYEETRRRLAREVQLNALAHALGGEVRLDALLAKFLPEVAALTGAESATVGLFDPKTRELHYPYHYRLPKILNGISLSVYEGIAGRVLRERRTIMVEDYSCDPDALSNWQTGGLRTVLIIPLDVEGVLVGTLELYTLSAPRLFDAEARAAAEAAAQLVGVAVQRARLFEEEQQQRRLSEALAEASLAVNSSLELEDTLGAILEQVACVLPGDAYNIMLIEGVEARIVRRREPAELEDEAPREHTFIVADVPGLRAMANTGEPWLVMDTQEDPAWNMSVGQRWIRAYVGAPIQVGKITVGFLNVNGKTPGQFGAADARRLQAFAAQVAVAIENASLYQQLRDYAQQLEQQVQQRTAQLQAQVARSAAILDSATDGIIVTDSQGQLVQVNPVADTWLQHTLSAEEALHLQQAFQELAARAVDSAAEHPTIELGLDRLDLELTAAPVRVASPDTAAPVRVAPLDTAAVVVVAHDITQRKTLERMQSQFVSNVSHELRTPITTILLYASMLQRGKPEKHAQYLQALVQEAERQARLVEDVMQISRLDAGQLEVALQPVALDDLVRSMFESQRLVAQERALDFTCVLSQTELWVSADPDRLRQVFNNLVQNAFTYTGAGGRVTLSTEACETDGGWAMVTLRDTGIGIPEEELPHIFERFYRGTEPRRRQLSGSGLGLAIVRELLEMQGGKITVESQVGSGSAFTVWLPLAPPPDL